MHNVIFIVRDGPEDKPNRFYPAICVGPSSQAQMFEMMEVDEQGYPVGEIAIVHRHQILRLDWEKSRHVYQRMLHESLSNLRRAAAVPGAVGEQAEPVLPGGTGLAQR